MDDMKKTSMREVMEIFDRTFMRSLNGVIRYVIEYKFPKKIFLIVIDVGKKFENQLRKTLLWKLIFSSYGWSKS